MKKIFSFLLVSAAVLAMAACQKEQQVVDTPENGVKEVTTQFVLNIAAAPSTKMTADAVQQNQNFRGIQDVKLFTYKTGMTSGTPYVLSTTGAEEKEFDFGAFFASGGIDNSTGNNQSGDKAVASKRVLQLSIPVGVDAVTFYGKATKSGSESAVNDAELGATNATATTISGTPGETVIAAKSILTAGTKTDQYDATGRLMIGIINDILARGVDAISDEEMPLVVKFGPLPAVTWAQYGHRYENDKLGDASRYKGTTTIDHPLEGLEEILGKSYYLFTYIVPPSEPVRPKGEYRGGSSASVKRMVSDMYKVISAASGAEPTTPEEANAKRLADVILDRASLYFYTPGTPGGNPGDYKAVSEIKSLLVTSYKIYTEDQWNTKYGGAQNLNGYPFEDFGVPEGAAQLGFYYEGQNVGGTVKTKDEFYYRHPNFPLVNPTMEEFEPRKYLYPAELWYYVNSPIRTTSSDVTVASYPDGITPWNTDSNWSSWTFPGKVEGSTRGVAVVNSINYGVAMLKTNVVFKDGTTVLEDNRYELTNHAESNKTIAPADAQIELRGVLVGGVNPRMNWQFTRKYTTTGTHEGLGDLSLFDGVIYDHSIASTTVPTPTGSPNYTLVYDNYNSSEDEANQNDVYVALEFVNNGDAFYGRDNMIPNGGVFYLVAKIEKPNADQRNTLHAAFPTDHQIPPVYGVNGETVPDGKFAGESKKIARVFIQDFVTNATFRIGQYSLQNAYYSVPDLRASQMSLGLSVDLQWIPGINYVLDL